MTNFNRFCFICCCLAISAYTTECSKRLEGANEPPTSTDLEIFEIVQTMAPVSRLAFLTRCPDLCGFTNQNRRISTKVSVDSKYHKKSWFVNRGFVQSLLMLIFFAVCVVLSGVISLIFILLQVHLFLTALFLLPSWMLTVALLITLVFPDLAKIISLRLTCSTSVQQRCTLVSQEPGAPQDSYPQTGINSPINRMFVCFSSDHVQTIIAMLLLRSGDVELNPGPLRDGDTSSQEHGQPAHSVQESPQQGEDIPRVGTTEEEKPTDQLHPVQEPFADLPAYIGSDNAIKNGITVTHDQDEDSEGQPQQGNKTLLQHTIAIPSTGDTIAFNRQATSQDTTNSMVLPSIPPLSSEVMSRSKSQVILHSTILQRKDEKQLVMEAYADLNKKTDSEKKDCFTVFDEVMIKLFLNLIRLYRDGKTIDFCPQCFEMKERNAMRQSHIIPKCMLEAFQLIHVPVQQYTNQQTDTRFLINFSRWSRFPPDKATATLLCEDCENYSSRNESGLKGVYLSVSNNKPEASTCQIRGMKYRDLHHILAQILFRGLLINVDIDDDQRNLFMHEEFRAKFTLLWNYSRDVDFQNPPDIRLFLLQNKSYNDETTYSLFSMERVLRSPHYTELVSDKAGLYLYSKIDCFHIVFPIDKKSESYYNTFRNGLYTDNTTEELFLLLCTRPRRRRPGERSADDLTTHFPDVLLQWNVQLYNNYIIMMLNQPSKHKIRDYDIPFILFPGEQHKYPGSDLDLTTRTNMASELTSKAKSTIDLTDAEKFDLNNLDHTRAIKGAADNSPLRVVMVSKAEYRQVIDLKAKLSEMKLDFLKSKEDQDILLSRIDRTLAENQMLKEALHKEVDIRRESETREQDLRIELIKNSLRSYEAAYKTLSQKYSAEIVRCKGETVHKGLREEITTNTNGTEHLMKSAEDLEEVYHDCVKMHTKFEKLQYSRTLSN